jgi:hypothetical protein
MRNAIIRFLAVIGIFCLARVLVPFISNILHWVAILIIALLAWCLLKPSKK